MGSVFWTSLDVASGLLAEPGALHHEALDSHGQTGQRTDATSRENHQKNS